MHCKGRDFMRTFDYSFLKNKSIPANTVNLLTTVEKLTIDRRMVVDEYPKLFEEDRKSVVLGNIVDIGGGRLI